mgnify:CR=1 FL=1
MKKLILLITVLFLVCPASYSFSAPAEISRPGQTESFGSGDDGAVQAGMIWPDPRFTDNGDGTLSDNLTGLTWLKNANCLDTVGGVAKGDGFLTWNDALTWSANLAAGACGLFDVFPAGSCRLTICRVALSFSVGRHAANVFWLSHAGRAEHFPNVAYFAVNGSCCHHRWAH